MALLHTSSITVSLPNSSFKSNFSPDGTISSLKLEKRFMASPLLPSCSKKSSRKSSGRSSAGFTLQAFFNPLQDQPLFKEALKEPVAFMGGMFAGLLRLDLNEDPLKEWIAKTVEASGMSVDEVARAEEGEEDAPQQIEIE